MVFSACVCIFSISQLALRCNRFLLPEGKIFDLHGKDERPILIKLSLTNGKGFPIQNHPFQDICSVGKGLAVFCNDPRFFPHSFYTVIVRKMPAHIVQNAEQCVLAIAESLSTLDPDNRELYESNAGAYTEKLKALDQEYEEAVSAGKTDTLLFGDRFPFRYLVEDYGLKYYAAFAGCSAETEASFETIIFLAEKVDELGLKYVLTIDNSDRKIAQTIVQNTKNGDQKILTLDSMQAATHDEAAGGTDYISVMESNLSVLKEALS